jgi:hypothetical protein
MLNIVKKMTSNMLLQKHLVDDKQTCGDPALSYGFQEPIHSRINYEYDNVFSSLVNFKLVNYIVNTYITIASAISIYFIFNSTFEIISVNDFIKTAKTVNLPFCETPFAVTPYMAQGASALAHLPYVPLFLLGMSYAAPESIPTLDRGKTAKMNKKLLWIQSALQLFTSIGGHMLPNPRVVLNQEISILLAFAFLFTFLEITTPSKSKHLFKPKLFLLFTSIFMIGYLTIGLMPVIFMSFITAVLTSYLIEDSFGLITNKGSTALLSVFIPTVFVLLIETICCSWLITNISTNMPWHVVFDIMFWQVTGSAIDVIILSPRPSKFLHADNE